MRIGFLTHEPFFPPSGGGSAEAVYLVREMTRRGHFVTVFGPEVPQREEVEREWGITLVPFRAWQMGRYTRRRNLKYLGYPFFLERQVARWAGRCKLDLLFSQHTIAAVAAGRLRRRLGIPVVMNFLDFLTAFMETWPPFWVLGGLLKRLMAFELSLPLRYGADGVLAVSEPLAQRFARTGYPESRIHTLHYGFDGALFGTDWEKWTADTTEPATVVMHGSFDRHHVGRILREAMELVAANRSSVHFLFVGKVTPSLEKLLHFARELAPRVTVEATGFVPYAEVASILRRGRLGIVPYAESEGTHCAFVAKAVEYLALGIPVASTPLENLIVYFRGEPMIRFSGFDGLTFGTLILEWLAKPRAQVEAMGAAAAERVRKRLEWEVISRQAVDFIERVYQNQGSAAMKP